MRILVLGGTAWLGSEVAREALGRGHEVTALARGESGSAPAGVTLVRGDRARPSAYDSVRGQRWDGVIDVARQPGHVRTALVALAEQTPHWVFVSSCSVYAAHDTPGADESAVLLPPLDAEEATLETYGEGKVACEQAVLAAMGPEHSLVARSGLIGGPGDRSGRTGYWPLRFARPATEDGTLLVPDSPAQGTQLVDVRDLAAWLVDAVEHQTSGVFNAASAVLPLAEHLATARAVAGHQGPLQMVSPQWLADQGVQEWAGERSLPLWLHTPGWEGFGARDTSAASAAGLRIRPLADTLADTLAWELQEGPDRPRRAGLSPGDERALVDAARGSAGR